MRIRGDILELDKLTDKKLKTIYGKEIAKPIMIADGRESFDTGK